MGAPFQHAGRLDWPRGPSGSAFLLAADAPAFHVKQTVWLNSMLQAYIMQYNTQESDDMFEMSHKRSHAVDAFGHGHVPPKPAC